MAIKMGKLKVTWSSKSPASSTTHIARSPNYGHRICGLSSRAITPIICVCVVWNLLLLVLGILVAYLPGNGLEGAEYDNIWISTGDRV